jgi:pimeloyl-ACP methyl ester carboxylesterase
MTSGRFTTEDGCSLAYEVSGDGVPVLWQHGLGADRSQPAGVFPSIDGIQRITFECRGHGESELGNPARLAITQFADDAIRLFDHLNIDSVVVGGISLGAAISLRLAATVPSRVRALILARPAWVDHVAPITMKPYLSIADLLRIFGPEEGLRHYEQSEVLAEVESVSPDNAASLRSFFSRKGEESTIELLSRIPNDGPGLSANEIATIEVPTAVIANGEEYIHPIQYAEQLRNLISNSSLQIITSKSVDKGSYLSEFRTAIASFLQTPGVAQ